MAKLTKIFNKNTALDVLYVGGGAVAGTFAGTKAYELIKGDKADFDADGKMKPYISGGVPILVGLLLPSFAGKSTLVNKVSLGMIASGGSLIVKELLNKAGVEVNGVGNVMMGNVMMQGVTATGDLGNGPSLSGASSGGYDSYTPTSYDTTPAFSGEMDF
jgi:hypothetical protein